MSNSVFITDSALNYFTGGGIVSINYIEALKNVTQLRYIICGRKIPNDVHNGTPVYSINPLDYGYKESTPFFKDYMAYHIIEKEPTEVVMSYGCPWGLTIEELKREFQSKIICDLAPHIIETTKEDHIKLGGSYDYPHLVDDDLWGLYSRHLRFADIVIVHSYKSAGYIKQKAKINIEPIVIPHGCYLPEKIPEYPQEIQTGYFGALGVDKGIFYLINAWIPLNFPNPMLVGGFNSEKFKVDPQYMKHFKPLGFFDKIIDFYKQINIGVFPSITEGFNICALDCMAHGRPVIVAEGAGVSEIVEDGKEGFVVPIRDIKAISDRIRYFYENPSEINRMGSNARQKAEKYTWDIIKKRYIEIMKGLL